MADEEDAAYEAVSALGDPVRRRLYRYVAARPGWTGRDAAAEAAGISRSLAAHHLDRLVESGLLTTSFQRLSGRTGPGAGRPAKVYRRAEREHRVSLPPRAYDTLGRLLAGVVEEAGLDRELQAAARAAGRTAEPDTDPVTLLRERGYQPFEEPREDEHGSDGDGDGDGTTLRLHNCPFHALAEQHPALVCGMNLALIEGLLAGRRSAGGREWTAVMDPRREGCCVALKSKKNGS
ncbi:helix-turn-helix transcriptional regulator [Streptomyces aidingensis]|uniref:Predicted transcriptional regulator, ArsR family n=1 Tax=Streptomyces aidingensis TaxID=910347 RepID=A0A1I1LN49_9ACTN|nr:helix-turn-helix domain-containing protein [Streptomyces aidingensis]SFC74366.1 Predicted transcriptional regulator, ArsR family [Streptomyces aidingensis]